MQPSTPKKISNNLILEIVGVVVLLVGGYFGYTTFFAPESATTVSTSNIQLGKNFASFKTMSKGVDFDLAFLQSEFVKNLEDHTQTFTYSVRRGRIDPFLPIEDTKPIRYDSTGSTR